MSEDPTCPSYVRMGSWQLKCDLPIYHRGHKHHTRLRSMLGTFVDMEWEMEPMTIGSM
jgi:hypothetical protein